MTAQKHGTDMSKFIRKASLRAKRTVIDGWSWSRPRFTLSVGSRRLVIPATPTTGWMLSWQPDWKTQLIAALLSERPGLFVDVGANIGQTLLDYCASPVRKGYVGFEPSALCVDHLNRIIDANTLDDCMIYPMALASQSKPLKFYTHGATDPGASIISGIEPDRPAQELVIPAYRYDDIAAEISGAPAALFKIDVEGAESAVLEGMASTLEAHQPLIICEVLNRDASADAVNHRERYDRLLKVVHNLNYRVYRICKSSNQAHVIDFEPVQDFPDDVYTERSRHTCDYVFGPADWSPPRLPTLGQL